MIGALIAFGAGFALGWYRAKRREGTRADCVQMGFAHGIPAAILGFAVSITLVNVGA
ncbi:MAG: hypothetical protein AAFU72_09190 [Pseudomonadota bacterium]